ncbi:MAG TPA: hypothetical protein VKS23_06975 [Thermoanaerobaculia bacterium]|nr:hypothetical protein [Thermoanaerobaculia bacterium]
MRRAALLAAVLLGVAALACVRPRRPSSPLPEQGFRADISAARLPASVPAGSVFTAHVTVRNASPVEWRGGRGLPNALNLAYHWLSPGGETLVFDGRRTPLPRRVAPGESVSLEAAIDVPVQPGDYVLELDLVQESVAWFGSRGSRTSRVPVRAD